MTRGSWTVVLSTIALLLAACAGDADNTAGQTTSSPAAEASSGTDATVDDRAPADTADDGRSTNDSTDDPSPGTADSGPLASMLDRVSDRAVNRREVLVTDYEGALAAAGLEWPETDDRDELGEVLAALTFRSEPPILATGAAFESRPIDVDEWRTQFGFSIADTRSDLFTGEAPGTLKIFETDRSVAEIEDAIRSDPVWSGELNEVVVGDDTMFTWGDDPLELRQDRISAPRQLGRGGALAVLDDGTVVRSVDPAVVEDTLQVLSGETPSLLDDDHYRAVADALDAAGAYTALFTSENITVDPLYLLGGLDDDVPTAEEVQERIDSIVTVPPYLALGIGNRVDLDADPQGVLVVAFAAASPEAAEATVAAMEEIVGSGVSISVQQPWSELLTITATATDGNLAVIEFQTENPRLGLTAYYQRDNLFASF